MKVVIAICQIFCHILQLHSLFWHWEIKLYSKQYIKHYTIFHQQKHATFAMCAVKWLQFLLIKWYLSPAKSLPIAPIIVCTSSSAKSVWPISTVSLKLIYNDTNKKQANNNNNIFSNNTNRYLKFSPSSSASFGAFSNTPVKANGWPPYAYSENIWLGNYYSAPANNRIPLLCATHKSLINRPPGSAYPDINNLLTREPGEIWNESAVSKMRTRQ